MMKFKVLFKPTSEIRPLALPVWSGSSVFQCKALPSAFVAIHVMADDAEDAIRKTRLQPPIKGRSSKGKPFWTCVGVSEVED